MRATSDTLQAGIKRTIRILPTASGASVLTMSLVVIAGWLTDRRDMQSFMPGFVTMKVTPACGLAAASVALLLLRDGVPRPAAGRIARILGFVVAMLGIVTLAQYVLNIDFGVDQFFIQATYDEALTTTPGRMAAITAFAFSVLGTAIVTMDVKGSRRHRPNQFFAVAVLALGLMGLLGYGYGAIPTAGLGQGVQIAPFTALGFVLLGLGLLVLRSDTGWMDVLVSDRAGGALARRLLPLAFIVPMSLGALRFVKVPILDAGTAAGSALVAVIMMVFLGVVIWRTARELDSSEMQRRATQGIASKLALEKEAGRARGEAEQIARTVAEAARDAAQQAVRETGQALALLDLVLDSTPVGFAHVGLDCRYKRVNHAFAEASGASVESLIGCTPEAAGQRQAHTFEQLLNGVLASGNPIADLAYTTEDDAKQGSRRWWLASAYPVRSEDHELIGVGLLVIETTERRRMEEQLIQSQKLEAIGLLAGGIAHDFNNLLTAIISYSSIVLDELPQPSSSHSDVLEIRLAAERAASLTGQLLAFSRGQVLEPRRLSLRVLVHNLENMLRMLLHEDIDLRIESGEHLGRVNADPGKLEQVLVNLCVNARDAMPDGGQLTISTDNVFVGAENPLEGGAVQIPPGSYVVLSVADQGCGMSDEEQQRIFEPFYTTKEVGKGTGLGLSTVYGIVKQSGGHVQVESGQGQGTVFRIFLPLDVTEKLTPPKATSKLDSNEPATETILLVEDNPQVRAGTSRLLSRKGYTVLEATSGVEALRICDSHAGPIELLLTDMVMPQMGGGEVASEVHLRRPATKVLFMSGYTEDAMLRKRLVNPSAVFLGKPFTGEQLTRTVREVLNIETAGPF